MVAPVLTPTSRKFSSTATLIRLDGEYWDESVAEVSATLGYYASATANDMTLVACKVTATLRREALVCVANLEGIPSETDLYATVYVHGSKTPTQPIGKLYNGAYD
jgi:hypothetical protein